MRRPIPCQLAIAARLTWMFVGFAGDQTRDSTTAMLQRIPTAQPLALGPAVERDLSASHSHSSASLSQPTRLGSSSSFDRRIERCGC